MRRSSLLTALGVATLILACERVDLPTTQSAPDGGAFVISDGVHHNGNQHFLFLPPMVPQPQYTGTTDASLAPEVVVCDWTGAACGATVAEFSMSSGTGSEIIRYDATGEFYLVNWHTDRCVTGACTLDPARTYRLRVRVGTRELGFADVDVVGSGSQLRNVQTNEFIGLVNGRTLPVKFRIEQGVVGSLSVDLDPAEVRAGANTAATATVRDLHGNPLPGATVNWSSSGIPVTFTTATASTSGAGLATAALTAGAMTGTATIIGTSDGLSASALLTVVPAVIDQTTVLARMNDPRDGVAVVATGGLVYAIGGWTSYVGVKATNEVYDPATNQWTYRAPMPTARTTAAAAAVNGIIYVIGGHLDGSCCSSTAIVEAYDPATNTWTTKAAMSRPREAFGVAVRNGVIYAVGGWTPDCCAPVLATVEAFDPATNTWTPKASMPSPRSGHAVVEVNGRFYVVGGEFGTNFLPATLEYDPATDSWATKASIPLPRTRLGAAAVGGIVYTVGGWLRGNNGGVSTIEAYDPATNQWTTKSPLNIPRWNLGAAAVNGTVYAVGGINQILDVAELEAYQP